MVETRISRRPDIPALSALWREVFGDTEELTGAFFRLLWREDRCRVAERDGRIVSMGFCLPGAEARGLKCSYIYAMATADGARGGGLAAAVGRALVSDAFTGGADIVATLPAEESLCGWYASRLGMAPLFRKGGPGVEFPAGWHEFSRLCGAHDPDTPARLWAVARPGVETGGLEELGWECCFD